MQDQLFNFTIKPWSFRDEAVPHNLCIRVKLELYGLPLHAWDTDSIQRIISGFALLESVSPTSLGGQNLSLFEVSAFCLKVEDVPNSIPVVLGDAIYKVLVTIKDVRAVWPLPSDISPRSDWKADWGYLPPFSSEGHLPSTSFPKASKGDNTPLPRHPDNSSVERIQTADLIAGLGMSIGDGGVGKGKADSTKKLFQIHTSTSLLRVVVFHPDANFSEPLHQSEGLNRIDLLPGDLKIKSIVVDVGDDGKSSPTTTSVGINPAGSSHICHRFMESVWNEVPHGLNRAQVQIN
ncbi:hypothetical protein COCNU_11G013010 [Cocos nucifera]|uniref:DUF4283 domain-containing protein n=1 Tax=Cocos nucifera TaxID=13894 RepID=A0A8K0N9X3_COCNU|nr:hypothetical protein COCNU_11G013010 [Cocos nucifera]